MLVPSPLHLLHSLTLGSSREPQHRDLAAAINITEGWTAVQIPTLLCPDSHSAVHASQYSCSPLATCVLVLWRPGTSALPG